MLSTLFQVVINVERKFLRNPPPHCYDLFMRFGVIYQFLKVFGFSVSVLFLILGIMKLFRFILVLIIEIEEVRKVILEIFLFKCCHLLKFPPFLGKRAK